MRIPNVGGKSFYTNNVDKCERGRGGNSNLMPMEGSEWNENQKMTTNSTQRKLKICDCLKSSSSNKKSLKQSVLLATGTVQQ
jgi:hypothetical protein